MEINNELGTFDVIDTATGWDLYFYPEQFAYNSYDITTLSFNIFNNSTVEKNDFFGNSVLVSSATTEASPGITTTIVSIANTYRSAKVLVMAQDQNGEATGQELNIIHDGTDVSMMKYGDMLTTTDTLFVGFGTFDSQISGGNLIVEFTPTSGLTTMTVNSSVVAIAATGTGIGSTALETSLLSSTHTSIAADASPVPITVASFDNPYGANYFVVQASDTTNSEYELLECVILRDSNQEQLIEFGNVQTVSGVGTVGVAQTVGTRVGS
jgi:hypothetical protein